VHILLWFIKLFFEINKCKILISTLMFFHDYNIKKEVKMKKLLALLLAMIMVFSLAACAAKEEAPAAEEEPVEVPVEE